MTNEQKLREALHLLDELEKDVCRCDLMRGYGCTVHGLANKVRKALSPPTTEGTPLTTKRQIAGISKSDLERYEDMLENAIELETALHAKERELAATRRDRDDWMQNYPYETFTHLQHELAEAKEQLADKERELAKAREKHTGDARAIDDLANKLVDARRDLATLQSVSAAPRTPPYFPELLEAADAHECERDSMDVCRHCETVAYVKEQLSTLQSVSAVPQEGKTDVSFTNLRAANLARLPKFKNKHGQLAHSHPQGKDWSPAQWLQAVIGEMGEYANIRKKFERGDLTAEEFAIEGGKELADVQIYLDILAYQVGVDLGAVVVSKFNDVSRRVGCDVFLEEK